MSGFQKCQKCGDRRNPQTGMGVHDTHIGGNGPCGDAHTWTSVFDLVVTRHQGLIDLALQRGWIDETVEVKAHVGLSDVRGKHVFGVLPLSLAAEAASVTEVPLDVPREWRGRDLSADETAQIAGQPCTYSVQRL